MKIGKILVVDDDRPSALALSVRLRAAGFDVQTAVDAEAASTIALRDRPDLMLLKMEMPRYSGVEFHECLQFSERGRRIPVVYLSEHDTLADRLLAHQRGARAIISKPYDARRLLCTVHEIVADRCSIVPEEVVAAC